jgi:hypothetical protein
LPELVGCLRYEPLRLIVEIWFARPNAIPLFEPGCALKAAVALALPVTAIVPATRAATKKTFFISPDPPGGTGSASIGVPPA